MNKLSLEKVVEKMFSLHSNLIVQNTENYENVRSIFELSCKICKHNFTKIVHKLLRGEGCPSCNKRVRYNTKTWIQEAIKRRGNEFDYSNVQYINAVTHVKLIHNKCGNTILQQPFSHLRKAGCQYCGGNARRGHIGFTEDVDTVHGKNEYEILSQYKNEHTHIQIKCLTCSLEFRVTPSNFIHRKSGCPRCCNGSVSKIEQIWLDSLSIPTDCRQILIPKTRYRVDALVDNTIYEFYGSFWHGDPRKFKHDKINPKTNTTFAELYKNTKNRESELQKLGYKIVSVWEIDFQSFSHIITTS